MGRTNIYGPQRSVFVVANQYSATWLYGFSTKIDAAESTQLGQTPLDGTSTPILPVLFGVNAPKPAIYSKKTTTYSIRSFADSASIPVAPWRRVRKSKTKSVNQGGFIKYVNVSFSGKRYAWGMHPHVYEAIGGDGRTALGIADCTNVIGALRDYIWGSDKGSKPPRARKTDTDNNREINTFYGQGVVLADGWVDASTGGVDV